MGTTRFLDSNIFICVLSGDPAYSAKSLRILLELEEGRQEGWTSTLVLSQVFSYLKKKHKFEAVDKFYEYLDGSPISVTPTTREDLEAAKALKGKLRLPWSMWDDLVIASQMSRLGITEIHSADTDFNKISGIKRVF